MYLSDRTAVNFSHGAFSYATKAYKQNRITRLNFSQVEGCFIRLQFDKCLLKDILECTYKMFRNIPQNLDRLVFFSFHRCKIKEGYFKTLMQILKVCKSLETLFCFSLYKISPQFLPSLHDLVLFKAKKRIPLNIII